VYGKTDDLVMVIDEGSNNRYNRLGGNFDLNCVMLNEKLHVLQELK